MCGRSLYYEVTPQYAKCSNKDHILLVKIHAERERCLGLCAYPCFVHIFLHLLEICNTTQMATGRPLVFYEDGDPLKTSFESIPVVPLNVVPASDIDANDCDVWDKF